MIQHLIVILNHLTTLENSIRHSGNHHTNKF